MCRILTTYFAPITRVQIQKKKIALTVLLLKGKIFILQTPTLQDNPIQQSKMIMKRDFVGGRRIEAGNSVNAPLWAILPVVEAAGCAR